MLSAGLKLALAFSKRKSINVSILNQTQETDLTATPLPTVEEIIARFHRLRITIGLTHTQFGYASTGDPRIVKRLEEGRKANAKTRRQLGYALDELEKGHSIPMPIGKWDREQKKNIDMGAAEVGDNIPTSGRNGNLSDDDLEG